MNALPLSFSKSCPKATGPLKSRVLVSQIYPESHTLKAEAVGSILLKRTPAQKIFINYTSYL
jgi:hypothetical protein